MEFITRPGKQYRRYRHENRYNTPLLIFIIDTAISLAKICLVLTMVLIAWTVGNRLLNSRALEPDTKPVTNIAATDGLPVTAHAVEPLSSTAPSKSVKPDKLVGKIETSGTLTANHQKPKDNTPLPSDKNSSVEKPQLTDEKWILTLNPASHIIQFGSSTDVLLFEEFIPVIDNGTPIAIYHYKQTPTDKPVFGIATGVYESPEAALAAIDNFSNEARAYGPWVRQVSTLISSISSVTSNALPE